MSKWEMLILLPLQSFARGKLTKSNFTTSNFACIVTVMFLIIEVTVSPHPAELGQRIPHPEEEFHGLPHRPDLPGVVHHFSDLGGVVAQGDRLRTASGSLLGFPGCGERLGIGLAGGRHSCAWWISGELLWDSQ